MDNMGVGIWNTLERILRFAVFRVLHIRVTEDKWENFMQFIRFGIVGLSNTVISYIIYVVVLLLFQKMDIMPESDYLIAQFISFVLSVLWSFYWNRKYVFKADREGVPWLYALAKTYVSYAFTGLFLNTLLSYIWVQCVGIPKVIAPIINLVVSVPINFMLNKFWAFRSKG